MDDGPSLTWGDVSQYNFFLSSEDMPAGQTPHTVILYAHNDLVDFVQPGDRVTITGIYRATPLRVNPRMRNVKSVYKTHIDVVHYRKLQNKRLKELDSDNPDDRWVPSRAAYPYNFFVVSMKIG